MGRIVADAEAVARLDNVLLHESPYISDYISIRYVFDRISITNVRVQIVSRTLCAR